MNFKIQVQSLHKSFYIDGNECAVLKNVSIMFEKSGSYGVLGSSGSGKSTFMHILAGLEEPTSGAVFFGEKNIHKLSHDELSRILLESLGMVFQLPYLMRELSVLENVMLKGLIKGNSYDACEDKAYALLKTIGLESKAYQGPSVLSGGQQQRVALLRALFNEPNFLLADEPTGNLDKKTAASFIDFLFDCHKQWKMGLIISTHDLQLAQRLHTTFYLSEGTLVPQALPSSGHEQVKSYHN